MGDEKVLAQKFAKEFLKDPDSLDLSDFTAIVDEAAESLSKYTGDLYLNGLTSLSDAAAESLGKHKGELQLDGLTSLSDDAAESLRKHRGALSLNGLTSLSDAAAKSLGEHKTGKLYLDGLTSLSEAAAESLSCHKEISSLGSFNDLSSVQHIKLKLTVPDIYGNRISPEAVTPEDIDRFRQALSKGHSLDLREIPEDELFDSKVMEKLKDLDCKIEFGEFDLNLGRASLLSSFAAAELNLCNVQSMPIEAAKLLLAFKGSLRFKLDRQDEEVRSLLESHWSVRQWAGCSEPHVDVVCKNCGEHAMYTGDSPFWSSDFCVDCEGESPREELD